MSIDIMPLGKELTKIKEEIEKGFVFNKPLLSFEFSKWISFKLIFLCFVFSFFYFFRFFFQINFRDSRGTV